MQNCYIFWLVFNTKRKFDIQGNINFGLYQIQYKKYEILGTALTKEM